MANSHHRLLSSMDVSGTISLLVADITAVLLANINFSVTDKLLNGIAIAIIQVISPCSDGKTKEQCHDEFGPFFGRMMIVFTVLSIIITVSDYYRY